MKAADLPALHRAADEVSKREQNRFLRLQQAELGALLASAAGGALSWHTGGVNIAALVGAAALLIAIAVRAYVATAHPERRWYDARALAESAKTLCWQYAVCGEAFPHNDQTAHSRYLERMRALLDKFSHLDIPSGTSAAAQLSPVVEHLRRSDRSVRQATYRDDRVLDQQRWYSKEANYNRNRARQWSRALFVTEGAAALLGLSRGLELIDLDWSGVLVTLAAAILAWRQTKQFESLAESYSVTSHDVSLLLASIDSAPSEEAWATIVHDGEAAFSREHTVWLARRQSANPN